MEEIVQAGAFAKLARAYSDMDLVVMPCGGTDGKKPLGKWRNRTKPYSAAALDELIEKYPTDNIGLLTGPSQITIVDIDGNDPTLLQQMIERCGDTPVKARTPRGGWHLYYRGTGEKTLTRLDSMAVDVRAIGGFVVMPPSRRPDGEAYRFVDGGVEWFETLPTVKPGSLPLHDQRQTPAGTPSKIGEGDRNKTLFNACLQKAAQLDTLPELEAFALAFNAENCSPTLPEAEVMRTAQSVWNYKREGKLWLPGRESTISVPRSSWMEFADNPTALFLLGVIQFAHEEQPGKNFALSPKAMAPVLGWTPARVRAARDDLIRRKKLHLKHKGGRGVGDPDRYQLEAQARAAARAQTKGAISEPNTTKHLVGHAEPERIELQASASRAGREEILEPLKAFDLGDQLDLLPAPATVVRLRDMQTWSKGKMPAWAATAMRQEQHRRRLRQDELAAEIGISRPQLANALQGRFGLSASVVQRVKLFLISRAA